MSGLILAIDQGTTSSRAIVFDGTMKVAGIGQKEFTQHLSGLRLGRARSGGNLGKRALRPARQALRQAEVTADEIAAIGITNQRETVVIWDKATGKPIHNAIVWQDRRTAPLCQKLKKAGLEKKFSRKTGLLLDPYFSGTKIAWLLDNVKGARARAETRRACWPAPSTAFLIWRLTGGKVHATDATNASRTLVYNIAEQRLGRRAAEDPAHSRDACCRR